MQLTFRDGLFYFEDGGLAQILKLFEHRDDWQAVNPDDYATASLKAAARFRRFADDKAESVFKRAFVQFYDVPPEPLPLFLDPHQIKGVNWILSRSRSYLAHAPGAGKTCQAVVASILARGLGKVVFIVPPTLTLNWAREIAMWLEAMNQPWRSVAIVPGSSEQDTIAWRSDFLIVPDSMLTRPWVLTALQTIRIRFIAVDEASRFKEAESKRTIALFGGEFSIKPKGKKKTTLRSRGLVQSARHAVLLDGSPMPNRPMELWAPTYAMAPETIDCMPQQDFGFKYCGAKMNERGHWEFRHSSNEDELKAKLQKNFMHVVSESELSHPERRRSILFVNEDVRTREHIAWEQKNISKLEGADNEAHSQGDIAKFRRELGIRKIPFVANYVSEMLSEKSESILLFAWHRDVVDGLRDLLHKYAPLVVMGGTSSASRESAFDSFQNGYSKLIIGNIGALGRGHNLQRAKRVIFAEFSWTDELNKQCEKRASRKGNEENFIRCEYVVAPNSMDEVVLRSVFTKERTIRRVIG